MSQPKRLRVLIYGPAKTGKSRLAETCPGPRLILDAEGGTDYLVNPQTVWADVNQPPPTERADGTPLGAEDTVVLFVDAWPTLKVAEQWLQSGKHPFNSVIVDSLTELQKRLKENVSNNGAMDQQAWGRLLDQLDLFIRRLRDLTRHRTNPLWTVVVTALVDERMGRMVPLVQGGLAKQLGGIFDVLGYLRPTGLDESGNTGRELVIAPRPDIESGDRTDILTTTFGQVVANPNLTRFLEVLNA